MFHGGPHLRGNTSTKLADSLVLIWKFETKGGIMKLNTRSVVISALIWAITAFMAAGASGAPGDVVRTLDAPARYPSGLCSNGKDLYVADWKADGTVDVVTDGLWHLVTGVYDNSGVISLYIDGVLDNFETCTSGLTINPNDKHVFINGLDGSDPAGERHFDGRIDDVRIYDYALSDSEIRYLAGERIYVPLDSPANLYDDEPMGSKKINLADFAILAGEWLENTD